MNQITEAVKEQFISILKTRFQQNMHRHKEMNWSTISDFLNANESILNTIYKMEKTGGEPDLLKFPDGRILYLDFSKESPSGRRSLCYDHEALINRKKNPPKNSAEDISNELGIKILNEKDYKYLQSIENFDTKTSSWIETPEEIRKLGGALFADFRYKHVFIYHNGADSYYSARGFRGSVEISI